MYSALWNCASYVSTCDACFSCPAGYIMCSSTSTCVAQGQLDSFATIDHVSVFVHRTSQYRSAHHKHVPRALHADLDTPCVSAATRVHKTVSPIHHSYIITDAVCSTAVHITDMCHVLGVCREFLRVQWRLRRDRCVVAISAIIKQEAYYFFYPAICARILFLFSRS